MAYIRGLQSFKDNKWHSQEFVGAALTGAILFAGSKKVVQNISGLVAASSTLNGASVLIIGKSIHTLWSKKDAGKRRSAEKALLAGSLILTAFTVAAFTNHKSTKKVLEFTKEWRPVAAQLAAGTVFTATVTQLGISVIEYASAKIDQKEKAAERWKAIYKKAEDFQACVDDFEGLDKDKINAFNADKMVQFARSWFMVKQSRTGIPVDGFDDLIYCPNDETARTTKDLADVLNLRLKELCDDNANKDHKIQRFEEGYFVAFAEETSG